MNIKKIKFNALDFFILLVIIAAALSVVLRSGLKDDIVLSRQNEKVVYSIRIKNVQQESFDLISLDDEIFSAGDDKLMGTVIEKTSRPAETYIALDSGEIKKTYIPDRIDIMLTLETNGRVTDEGTMIDGNYFIACGSYISGYTDLLAFNFEVTGVQNLEENAENVSDNK